jgi:hypothetical protein
MELSSYSTWRGLSVWQLDQRVSACEMNASGSKSKYSPEQSTLIQQQSGSLKEESPRGRPLEEVPEGTSETRARLQARAA